MSHRNDAWMIVCDFDGTISTIDATDALLDRHAEPDWLDIERDWANNLISSKDCLTRQAALIHADESEIDALADELQIDRHFPAFVDWCDRQAIPVAVVSEGFDKLISKILANHGLGHLPVHSNRLVPVTPSTYQLETPFGEAACTSRASVCKCAVIRKLKQQTGSSHCLLVGDGRSDFCAAVQEADMVGAKSALGRHLESKRQPFAPITSFDDVTALAADLVNSTEPLNQRGNRL